MIYAYTYFTEITALNICYIFVIGC